MQAQGLSLGRQGCDKTRQSGYPGVMRYWWVNQNQTYRHEIAGGYLWSPKRHANGRRNPFYEFMREVAPCDIVFSFRNTLIPAIGIVSGYCRESPKPTEFGNAGTNWSQIGWKVDVRWRELQHQVRPKAHLLMLQSEVGALYSPLSANGNGKQAVYLTAVRPTLAAQLFSLIGTETNQMRDTAEAVSHVERSTPAPEKDIEEWEKRVEIQITQDTQLTDTDRQALVMARRGQGQFRSNVRGIEKACRITKVERAEHLVASHMQPWRDSSHDQRLDGENGLMLTPTVDHLFDKGFISFEDTGRLIISPVADKSSLEKMGISCSTPVSVGGFSEGQRRYLGYHRDNVLRMANTSQQKS